MAKRSAHLILVPCGIMLCHAMLCLLCWFACDCLADTSPMDGVRSSTMMEISFQCKPGSSELSCCSVNGPRMIGEEAHPYHLQLSSLSLSLPLSISVPVSFSLRRLCVWLACLLAWSLACGDGIGFCYSRLIDGRSLCCTYVVIMA